jgi:predicted AAA+ superfamily ATPase
MDSDNKKCWVLVSSLKENTTSDELESITPLVKNLVDEWQSSGKIMWSGSFEDNNTGMAVFEATEDEAQNFYEKYRTACSDVLLHHMHQWNAMPLLSILS